MTNILTETFLNAGFRYVYENGPAQVPTIAEAQTNGLNCVALAHLCVNLIFGITLPSKLLCTELFFDRQHFGGVPLDDTKFGDLVWLGEKSSTQPQDFVPIYKDGQLINWGSFPVNHVGVVVDALKPDDPEILHASQYHKTVVVSSRTALLQTPRYAVVHGVSRLRDEYVGSSTASVA